MGSRSCTEMNEVFQRAREAGRAGTERCWCPAGGARGNVFLTPSPPCLWMPRVEKGLTDPRLAVSRSVLHPDRLQVTPRPTTLPFTLSECARRRRKSCGNKSVPGLYNRIHKFILQKGAFLRACCALTLYICWEKET